MYFCLESSTELLPHINLRSNKYFVETLNFYIIIPTINLTHKEIGYPNNKIEERIDADCSPIPPQGDCTIPFQTSKNLTLTFPGTLGVHVARRADKQEDLEESRSPGPAVLLPLQIVRH